MCRVDLARRRLSVTFLVSRLSRGFEHRGVDAHRLRNEVRLIHRRQLRVGRQRQRNHRPASALPDWPRRRPVVNPRAFARVVLVAVVTRHIAHRRTRPLIIRLAVTAAAEPSVITRERAGRVCIAARSGGRQRLPFKLRPTRHVASHVVAAGSDFEHGNGHGLVALVESRADVAPTCSGHLASARVLASTHSRSRLKRFTHILFGVG